MLWTDIRNNYPTEIEISSHQNMILQKTRKYTKHIWHSLVFTDQLSIIEIHCWSDLRSGVCTCYKYDITRSFSDVCWFLKMDNWLVSHKVGKDMLIPGGQSNNWRPLSVLWFSWMIIILLLQNGQGIFIHCDHILLSFGFINIVLIQTKRKSVCIPQFVISISMTKQCQINGVKLLVSLRQYIKHEFFVLSNTSGAEEKS